MARTVTITPEMLRHIIHELSKLLPHLPGPLLRADGRVSLETTLEVWMLPLDAVQRASEEFCQLVISTAQWHHQLFLEDMPVGFVRSEPASRGGSSQRQISGVFESKLAQKIDHAISWVDQNLHSGAMVRLLIIPALYLHAFWVVHDEGDQLIVIERPPQLASLKLLHPYSTVAFLGALAPVPQGFGRQ